METKMHALVFLSLFLLVTVNTAGKGTDADECKPTRCKHNGPAIKFPFWLRNRQPPHCGYTGFELSCTTTKKKHTVLELPSSVKLFVKHINYTTQQIQVYDPHSCLPKQLQRLNISASPFQFVVVDESRNSLDSFSFFNCSSGKQGYNSSIFPCLSTHGYQVQAYSDRYTTLLGLLPPPPCRKMYRIKKAGDYREEDLEMENVDERQSKMIKKLSIVGLWCIQWYPVDRPSMNKVVRMFEGDKDLVMPQNPFASNDSAKRSSTAPSKVRHSSLDIISESD
ncbi:hypothetical protein FEM48_Zijuj03G0176100 [Ziziphus jujuba var. spinosa]|uniref:RING-type E3 ubiquitin transferase n=1 Tax=Ziziphus jujuba var. spinosa TaxID=714518 RepID=A0A978VRP7_ZIZJJ|nr:hypothetical protein FEM48_Zijuj03G0176100 [Ziziphus jujuba var. spinosa]